MDSHKYQCPEIINEIIQLMNHKVLHSIIAYLLPQTLFSLLADETRDISNHEQVVITLHGYLKTIILIQIFLGLFKSMLLQLNICIHH